MLKLLFHTGRYFMLMKQAFSVPEKWSIFRKRLFEELDNLGWGSVGIVALVSIFMGAVITIQSAYSFTSPWIPLYAVGLATRDTTILELAPTIISIILAGKVGSNIASEIGTMRVTDQIDALEIMGVNPSTHLILPKIVASVIINPFIILMSMFLSIFGGWLFGILAGVVTSYEYVYGIQFAFTPYYVQYALEKTVVFAFVISSVSAYQGYFTEGGALEVGISSTRAVVWSIVLVLLTNFFLTQLLLV